MTDETTTLSESPEDTLGEAMSTESDRTPLTGDALDAPAIPALDSSLTAIGTANTGVLAARASALGLTHVSGSADIRASAVGVASLEGDSSTSWSTPDIVVSKGALRVDRSAAAVVWAEKAKLKQSASAIVVGGDVKMKASGAAIVLGRRVTVSDDSRVLISTKAALIIAAGLLGGAGLLALLGAMAAKRWAEAHRGVLARLGRGRSFHRSGSW